MKGGRYRRGDMIGQTGLERLLDEHLRGRDGGERIEVDALGRPVQLMRREEPRSGRPGRHHDRPPHPGGGGARDGRQGRLGGGDGSAQRRRARPDLEPRLRARPVHRATSIGTSGCVSCRTRCHPLLNRALQGQYPPGLGLQDRRGGGRAPGRLAHPDGPHLLQRRVQPAASWTFKDWKAGGHGHVILRAVHRPLVRHLLLPGRAQGGPATRSHATRRPSASAPPTGIDLGGEKARARAVPPRPARARPAAWHSGDTVNMSIGQGQLLVTPLQVARMMAAVANGGVLWKPRLVQRVERPDGTLAYARVEQDDGPGGSVAGRVGLPPPLAVAAVVNDGGTGAPARIPGLEIAGKTGNRPDHRQERQRQGAGPRVVRLVRARRRSAGGRGGAGGAGRPGRLRSPPRSRARSTRPSSSRRSPWCDRRESG